MTKREAKKILEETRLILSENKNADEFVNYMERRLVAALGIGIAAIEESEGREDDLR